MNDIISISKNMDIRHNVTLQVVDAASGQVIMSHEGHNAATSSMLLGIGHYLAGEGIFHQGSITLSEYVPKYISLGTMGLINHDADKDGLPTGIGVAISDTEEQRFKDYMSQVPGFGADGYDSNKNNDRTAFGLGPMFKDRLGGKPIPGQVVVGSSMQWVADVRHSVQCELISKSHPRVAISFRDVVPEKEAEVPETIDVVYSAMISTAALKEFREPGKDYIFITEAGLWSRRDWDASGENGLLAGYRIAPPNSDNWDMEVPSNRDDLKRNILRVGPNQVVQVVWKIQIGAIEQLVPQGSKVEPLRWIIWNGDA